MLPLCTQCPKKLRGFGVPESLVKILLRLRQPSITFPLIAVLVAVYHMGVTIHSYSSTYCLTFSDCIGGKVPPFYKKFAWLKKDHKHSILMLVSHPDDDALWSGDFLHENGEKTHLVILNGGGDETEVRRNEFRQVERHLGIRGEFLLGYDTMSRKHPLEDWIKKRIETLVCGQKWDMIITHNPDGEYGHVQHQNAHIAVVDAVQQCCRNADKLHVFLPAPQGNGSDIERFSERKRSILNMYRSQREVIITFRDWKEKIVPLREYNYTKGNENCQGYLDSLFPCQTDKLLKAPNLKEAAKEARLHHWLYPYDYDWKFHGKGAGC